MSTLYSLNGAAPTPLPFRITLANGFTRTDPSTFTEDEIAEAGYVLIEQQEYDPATQALNWNGASFDVVDIPPAPPTPRWVEFSAAAMSNAAINEMLGGLISSAPGLYGGMIVGLKDASTGDSTVFINSWKAAFDMDLVSDVALERVGALAEEYSLPQNFIDSLFPPVDEVVVEPISDEEVA
jgi:hypothetical protein